jgi:sensor c-di-GMP phosphodiesterase-like protein
LGLRAVAEGIETEAQMTWLHQNGCTVGQGFLWGKSFSVDDFAMICTSAEQSMEGLQMTS